MGDEAQDYTATGPTDIAFRTGGDGTAIDNGVVAQGKVTGVTGLGRAAPGTISRDPVGVVGDGPTGVKGIGREVAGEPDSGIGVIGQGSIGVRGSTAGSEEIGVDGTSKGGIGVRGMSQTNDGIVGVSDGDRKSGVFGDNRNEKENESGSGVTGRTASPRGSGVFGFSDAGGIGVRGFSNSNDGIVGVSSGERKSGVFGDHLQEKGAVFGVSGRTLSPDGAGINGFSDRGIGVRGASITNHGVVGSSKFKDKSGVFGFHNEPAEAGFGVSGASDSPLGAGVNGFSVGYGGQFSGDRAPLRLEPAAAAGHPTTGFHQKGELYVDVKGDLFYCKDDGTPGTWFLVQLTPA